MRLADARSGVSASYSASYLTILLLPTGDRLQQLKVMLCLF